MRTGISVDVGPASRVGLDAIVADRTVPRSTCGARIVLLTAASAGTVEIMRPAGVSKTAVWRWQERFMEEGIEGLFKDKTRPPRVAPLGPEIADRVVALTLGDPPGETTHWTAKAMAKLVGRATIGGTRA